MGEVFETGAIETGTNVNSLGEASEQDMVRVRESMQKAQQMSSQIHGDQKKNTQVAQFLTFLFSAVQDDGIREVTVELFSKPDQVSNTMTLAVYEMIGLFLPFYAYKAHELWLQESFPVSYEIDLAPESYLQYITHLYRQYPLFESLDKDTLSQLLGGLLLYHRVVALEEGKTLTEYAATIRSMLP